MDSHLKVLFADVFAFYMKAHTFHWNVTGPLFVLYHDMFSDIYEDVWKSVDQIAEHIRVLGVLVPGSMQKIVTMSQLSATSIDLTDPILMVRDLAEDNKVVVAQYTKCFNAANELHHDGLANFLAARLEYHQLLQWKLDSILRQENT